jgi:hypothetical protein
MEPILIPADTKDVPETISGLVAEEMKEISDLKVVDNGIGPYEFWGHRATDTDLGLELKNSPEIKVDVTAVHLVDGEEREDYPYKIKKNITVGGDDYDEEGRGKSLPEYEGVLIATLEGMRPDKEKLILHYEVELE